MKAKDYKHAATRKPPPPPPKVFNVLSFVSGLATGLVVAFGIYLWAESLPRPDEVVSDIRTRMESEPPVDSGAEPTTALPSLIHSSAET